MMMTPATTEFTPDLLSLTPLSDEDLEWLLPRLESSRPGDALRGFCLDSYDARCRDVGRGEEYATLSRKVGKYPSLAFMPVKPSMLMAFSAARWVHPDSPIRDAVHDLHEEAVFRQMSGGVVGRPLVLSSNGSFSHFIENMTMFPKFSVNFGTITCSRVDENAMIVHHDDFYSWLDTIMAATYQALGRYFGHHVKIEIEIHSPWAMDHHLSW